MDVINFAYGSNMLYERIAARVGRVERLGTYKLHDWRLVFNAGGRFSTFANIEPHKGSIVEGVMYKLDPLQKEILDQFEFVPFNYRINYFKMKDGTIFYAYIGNPENLNIRNYKPNLYYINLLLDGARQNKLIDTYHSLINYKINNYKLKKGNKHKRF